MLVIAIWSSLLLAVATTVTAVIRGALERDEEEAAKGEALTFVRLSLTGIFGVVVGQAVSPLDLNWWWAAAIATGLMFALLIGSQLASRQLGHRGVGRALLKFFSPLINSVHLLFTPISLPKEEEPEEFEQELLDSVEEFGETIVREIMVPRIDMATVPLEATLSKAMSVFLSRGYSRLPVVGKSIDDIAGILYLKDVARILHESPDRMVEATSGDIARPVIYIPESKPVDDLLREMQLSSTHIAIIIDEYGGVAGLATMEDVIEEIVGEISDEYDFDVDDVDEIGAGRYRVNASYSLIELGELFELELDDEDVDSVGGLLTKELGRLPKQGDQVSFSGLTLIADRIEGRRKRLITVVVQQESNLADAQSAFEQLDQE